MKRVFPVLLILSLLLCACGEQPVETLPTTAAASVPTTSPAAQPTETTQTAETTTPETEAATVYRHPLTGEILDAPFVNRLVAVSTNNVPQALPHIGTSQADILYEYLVEGSATRCLAIYSDVGSVPKLGSIRSARTYNADIAYSYNAIFVHVGGSPMGMDRVRELDMDDLDGITGAANDYFYRDKDRLAAGYDLEHTMVLDGPDAVTFAEQLNYATTVDPNTTYGLNFAEDATPADGEDANQITIWFQPDGKSTTMTYDADDGLYYGTEYGLDFEDENTDKLVGFKNVFVLSADTWVGSDGVHRFMELNGEGDGYFATNGKLVPIKWHHEKDEDPFTYTLTDGTPLVQSVGTSYIAITALRGSIEHQ